MRYCDRHPPHDHLSREAGDRHDIGYVVVYERGKRVIRIYLYIPPAVFALLPVRVIEMLAYGRMMYGGMYSAFDFVLYHIEGMEEWRNNLSARSLRVIYASLLDVLNSESLHWRLERAVRCNLDVLSSVIDMVSS